MQDTSQGLLPYGMQLVVAQGTMPSTSVGLTVTPPSAATGTDTTEAQQHEVGAKPKRLVRKREPRQIQSQRMLEETSQIREVILVCN